MTDGWEQALADCEARLDAAQATLRAGASVGGAETATCEVAAFTVPDVTGPLPAPLVDRAREIVGRAETLERRLTGEQDRIRAELRRLPRLPPAHHPASFDRRA